MFDELIQRIKQLETIGVSVPIKMDDEGYFDRECPNENCLFQFKVFGEDWKERCKAEAIFCPVCRHEAPSKSWWTKEQLEAARQQAIGYLGAEIHNGLVDGARKFNGKQKPGLITMSMKVSGGKSFYTVIPISAQEAMKLKIECESCSTRFAVVGSAFFCPCCGFNSVERTFDDSLRKVETKLDNLHTIRAAIESAGDRDAAELTCRSLIESGLSDCVVAFQKLMESLYIRKFGVAKVPLNAFQRIDDGSRLWKEMSGEGYEEWVSSQELLELNTLFQKRHLLAHTEGFVDERYIQKSRDGSYAVGQRIVIREADVRRLVLLVKSLSEKARRWACQIRLLNEA